MSELQRRIARGEGVSQDFKFRIDDQKKIARTLAAFANTEGGSLLIGVKDNGKIAGVNPEEEYYMIEGASDLYTKPPVAFESKASVATSGFNSADRPNLRIRYGRYPNGSGDALRDRKGALVGFIDARSAQVHSHAGQRRS